MICNEIEKQLPAYLEDLLSREEKKSVTEHLASCPRCGQAFADFKMTERLVHGLDEVEPPPFFEQRIMSRVREEAGRKQGILRRLFYPLHIKIPIQALATLIVAVLAFHVYQTGDPEMKQMAPLPIPVTEHAKDHVAVESPASLASPPALTPIGRSSAQDLSEKGKQRLAVPPFKSGGKEERVTDTWAPVREERPVATESAAPVVAEKDKEIPQVGAVLLGKAQEQTEKRQDDQMLKPLPQEHKRQMKTAESAPSPSRMAVKAAVHRSVMELTVTVGDKAAAIQKIEARLDQLNARIIEREHRAGSEFLKAEISARNIAPFLKQLETIGGIDVEMESLTVPDEKVIIGIEIIRRP